MDRGKERDIRHFSVEDVGAMRARTSHESRCLGQIEHCGNWCWIHRFTASIGQYLGSPKSRARMVKWTPLSRPFFARNKLRSGEVWV
jgi:hypothetical protein